MINFYNGNINKLDKNSIFVFGSNPEGRHGAGAAKFALDNFGAIYSNGRGIQNNSYALPTKNLKKDFVEKFDGKTIIYKKSGKKSLTKTQIKSNIKDLYNYALKNSKQKFYIAYRFDNNNLNGYTSEEMFKMFFEVLDTFNNNDLKKQFYFSDTSKDYYFLFLNNNL